MFVAASSGCFPQLSLQETLDKLADLEYTTIEFVVAEDGLIRPSELTDQFETIVQVCRSSRRIKPVVLHFTLEPDDPNYMVYFAECCRLAKAIKVVVVTARSCVPGTPFNEEVERLQQLVHIATLEGVVVGLITEAGRMSEDPDTIGSLCKTVKGLGVSLDPSHYIFGHAKPRDYDGIIHYVCHVRLRDTTKEQFQVLIGQGTLEYGRLVIQLNKNRYNRTLCVDLAPMPNIDSIAELRKMRLLLESLL